MGRPASALVEKLAGLPMAEIVLFELSILGIRFCTKLGKAQMTMNWNCQVLPVQIRCLLPPKDDLCSALCEAFDASKAPALQDGDILFLSAKVAAIDQGRCRYLASEEERKALIRQEADYYLPNTLQIGSDASSQVDFPFTLKSHTAVPFAGVDESNGNGWHILWPEEPAKYAKVLRAYLAEHLSITRLGLVISDSTVLPARRGCIGISIAASGLQLLSSYQGQVDLFGRELRLSENNIVDRLCSFATLFMGEGSEQTPAVVLRGLESFVVAEENPEPEFSELFIEPEKDFYQPLLGK